MTTSQVTTQEEAKHAQAPTLAQIIDQSGKSLAQIARESEMSLSHISRLRSSDRLPSIRTSAKLAVVLDVPLGELIRAATEVNRPSRRRQPAAHSNSPAATNGLAPSPAPFSEVAKAVVRECQLSPNQKVRKKAA